MKKIIIGIFILASFNLYAQKIKNLPSYFNEQIKRAVLSGDDDIEITVKTKDLSDIEGTLSSSGYYYKLIRKEFTTAIFIHVPSNLNIPQIMETKLYVERILLLESIQRCSLYKTDPDVFFLVTEIPSSEKLKKELSYESINNSKEKISIFCNKRVNKLKKFVSKLDFFKLVAKDPHYYLY